MYLTNQMFKNYEGSNNPLAQYRMANFTKSWEDIAREVGIHEQSLMRFAKVEPQDQHQKISTALTLFEKLGVDFVEFISEGKYKLARIEEK